MIEQLLPDWVCSAEAFDDPSDVSLFPAERAVVRAAVAKRRKEFATGRACARRALAAMGLPPAPLLPGPRGEPRWPVGVVGSITHCAGYRAAAVAPTGLAATVGIDAEPDEALPNGVLDAIAVPEELPGLQTLATARPDVSWQRLLFSAKESVFKAWYPLTARNLGFDEAVITVDPDGGFTARILVAGPVNAFSGRWLASGGLILTAIVVATV